jgi:hypothetical protein
MKKLLLVALLCASSALAGLTATQINQVIAYCDTGYSSVGHLDLSGFDDNRALLAPSLGQMSTTNVSVLLTTLPPPPAV